MRSRALSAEFARKSNCARRSQFTNVMGRLLAAECAKPPKVSCFCYAHEFRQGSQPRADHREGEPEAIADMILTTRFRVSFFMNKFRRLDFISYNGTIEVHSSLLSAWFC